MINTWKFTKTVVKGEEFLDFTGNRYEYVTQRPYHDDKGVLPDGVVLTLRILSDTADYGVDKKTQKRRATNRGQNFDATVLCGCRELPFDFGDIVSLEDFDAEHSYALDFNLILRFKGAKLIEKAESEEDVAQSDE